MIDEKYNSVIIRYSTGQCRAKIPKLVVWIPIKRVNESV